jgi:hypothetical protein
LTIDDLWSYFIDNQRTFQHQWIIFGIRELNNIELEMYCSNKSINPPITDQPFNFSANYELRMFTSGCYYLDSNRNWQSDGLLVSLCFSPENMKNLLFRLLGQPFNQLYSNSMFFHSSINICRWFLSPTISNQLELCLFKCGFFQKQNCLSDTNYNRIFLYSTFKLCSTSRQERYK